MRLLSPFPNAEKLQSTSPPGQDITGSPGQCILRARRWGWEGGSFPAVAPCVGPVPRAHAPLGLSRCGPDPSAPQPPVLRCVPVAPSLPQISSASPCSRWRRPRAGSRTGASRSRSPSECGRMPPPCAMWDAQATPPMLGPFLLLQLLQSQPRPKVQLLAALQERPEGPRQRICGEGGRDPLGRGGESWGEL